MILEPGTRVTRLIDFGRLREASVPCFGLLERALTLLVRSVDDAAARLLWDIERAAGASGPGHPAEGADQGNASPGSPV